MNPKYQVEINTKFYLSNNELLQVVGSIGRQASPLHLLRLLALRLTIEQVSYQYCKLIARYLLDLKLGSH